jgi:hypothetical protein
VCAIGWQLQYVFRLPVLSTEAPLREAPVDGYHLKRSCTSKIDCIDGKSEEAGVNAGTVFKQHSFAFLQAVFPDQSAQSRKEAGAGQHPLGEHTPITLANDFHQFARETPAFMPGRDSADPAPPLSNAILTQKYPYPSAR